MVSKFEILTTFDFNSMKRWILMWKCPLLLWYYTRNCGGKDVNTSFTRDAVIFWIPILKFTVSSFVNAAKLRVQNNWSVRPVQNDDRGWTDPEFNRFDLYYPNMCGYIDKYNQYNLIHGHSIVHAFSPTFLCGRS